MNKRFSCAACGGPLEAATAEEAAAIVARRLHGEAAVVKSVTKGVFAPVVQGGVEWCVQIEHVTDEGQTVCRIVRFYE